jgi:energy-coupling factor transport system ATP-binding protein
MALVEVESLSFSYPSSPATSAPAPAPPAATTAAPPAATPALRSITFTLARGDFAVLCGPSGCGKTTLLRHLKTALTPAGTRTGTIRFAKTPLEQLPPREQAQAIGFVLQNPETQIVTDKVWHELAFGLESLGLPQRDIRLRVAEMASFFGIQEWYHRRTDELSGGQKQLLNLAAVMAMQPKLLVLDEPTSQLDPIAASEFLAAVRRANGELGVTVLLSEHRLEEALPLCDKLMVMSTGQLVASGSPASVARKLVAAESPMLVAMPTPMQAALAVSAATSPETPEAPDVPVSVREGRSWLEGFVDAAKLEHDGRRALAQEVATQQDDEEKARLFGRLSHKGRKGSVEPLITARDLWFRYAKNDVDVLRGMELSVYPGELLAIVGGNGTGKTTALGVLSGALRPYRGHIRVAGLDPTKVGIDALAANGLAVLPQDPQMLFLHNTIIEDLADALPKGIAKERRDARLAWAIEIAEIAGILTHHPYDVSGGEQQRTALAMALLSEPKLLFLDEPTKGMDAFYKKKFASILKGLCEDGLTVVMVSHDVEFCAAHASRCALFFDGDVVTEGSPRQFFSGNAFYTTAANRMTRGILSDVVTTRDLIDALTGAAARDAHDVASEGVAGDVDDAL